MMTEEDYFTAWQEAVERHSGAIDPVDLAILGGSLSHGTSTKPEPAFIFIAGYQAAIRATFPEIVTNSWLAYAASEDRSEGKRKPGVTIKNDGLYGFKTWIAASKAVGKLIVKVGSGSESRYVLVSASPSKTTITHKESPRFLSQLSQGEAEFTGTEFTDLLDLTLVAKFADCEPYFIYVALLASLEAFGASSLASTSDQNIAGHAKKILQDHKGSINNLSALDNEVQTLLKSSEFEATGLLSNWGNDAKLFSMYSQGIQKRYTELSATK